MPTWTTSPGGVDEARVLSRPEIEEITMTEALARVRNDAVLSRPGKKSARGRSVLARTIELAGSLSPRFVIGAILSALLVGIGVNALVLQRERHPAPLFAPPPQRVATPAPVASPPPSAPAPASVAREPSAPVATPTPAPARPTASVPRATDAIGELLRGGEAPPDTSRLVKEAQSALGKLGFSVKANGAQGPATDQALREFERAHGLPLSTEITPHLVRQLNAAARAAAH